LRKEIEEVEVEIKNGSERSLAEELGDVLWDYLNLVKCLEEERGIFFQDVFRISEEKYDERISGIEQGRSWKEIKQEQKMRTEKDLSK
jgi:NTP pyrophosphatase (non-canonical NTP hydrolase)